MGWKAKAKSLLVAAVMVATFFAWSWGQDWVHEGDWTRSGKILFGLAGIGIMAGIAVARYFHWTVGAFLSFVILRWVLLRMTAVSLTEVVMISACIVAALFVHARDDKNLLGNCLAVDGFLQASLGLLEVAGFFPFLEIKNDVVWPPIAAHGHPTILGPYLVATLAFIPGAFTVVKNATVRLGLQVGAAAVILACVLTTQSTMTAVSLAVLATLAAGFYLGARGLTFTVSGLVIVGVAIIALVPGAASATGRLAHWRWAWDHLTLEGYGPGTWMPVYLQKYMADGSTGPFFGQLHNDWLQGLFEFGWIGMVPVIWGTIVLTTITLKAMLFRRRELFPFAALFFTLAVNAFGNFIIHTMPCGALLAIGAIYLFRYDFDDSVIRDHYRALEKED